MRCRQAREKRVSSSVQEKITEQRGDSRRETNGQIKSALRKTLEDELKQFLVQVSELAEGNLERLEEHAVKTSQAMGRGLLEGVLNSRLRKPRPEARRQGSCGHRQRLVGERAKELVTLLGKVTFRPSVLSMLACRRPRGYAWGSARRRTVGSARAPDNRWGPETDQLFECAADVRRSGGDAVPLGADRDVRTASVELDATGGSSVGQRRRPAGE